MMRRRTRRYWVRFTVLDGPHAGELLEAGLEVPRAPSMASEVALVRAQASGRFVDVAREMTGGATVKIGAMWRFSNRGNKVAVQ